MCHSPPDSPSPLSGDAPLTLVTLGGAELQAHAPQPELPGAVLLGPGKAIVVLTYLALSPGRAASRDHLLDLFWADLHPDRADHALRQFTWLVRQKLGEGSLLSGGHRLELHVSLTVDRDRFLEAVSREALAEAVALYRGPFLHGFASPGGAESEHWMDQERERLRTIFVRAADELARSHLAGGRYTEALEVAEQMRAAEPDSERSWRLVIECLLQIRRLLAVAEADGLERMLASSHRAPSPATVALLRVVRQAVPSEPATDDQGLVSQMVGRETEFSTILSLWQESSRGTARHLHLTAPAGLGKTRLLGDVATRLRTMGVTVLSLRAAYGERGIGYALAAELARILNTLPGSRGISPAAAGALVSLAPALSSAFPGQPDTATGEDALRRRTLALSDLIHAAAEEQPFALLIDDVHWADESSLRLLLGVLERLEGNPVLMITAGRPTRSDGLKLERSHALALCPLTVPDTEILLASLGTLPSEAWVRMLPGRLHAASGGVPLLILESLRLALEQGTLSLGAQGWHCPVPGLLEAALQSGSALRHRVEQLDRDSRWLLNLLATAGVPVEPVPLARAADRPGEAVEFAFGQLERRGFVQRSGTAWEFAHDEIAERIRELGGKEVEVAAHAALGSALLTTAGPSEAALLRAGRHLEQGGRHEEVAAAFTRWTRLARVHGDARPGRRLATEFLGASAEPGRSSRLARALPFALRFHLTGRHRLVAAVAILAAGAGAMMLRGGPGTVPDAELILAGADSAGRYSGIRVDVRREAWAVRGPIFPLRGHDADRPPWPRGARDVQARPHGTAWLYWKVVPDSGTIDVFLLDQTGHERRLTFTARDDGAPSWSPDGRFVVLSTARWSPQGNDDSDIGIFDPDYPDSVRQVTRGPAADLTPFWSPDGTRIAFVRRHYDLQPSEVCEVTVDGRDTRCVTPQGREFASLLGWLDSRIVVGLADSGRGLRLVRISLPDGGAAELRDEQVQLAGASPDGRWIALQARSSPSSASSWLILPTDEPSLARHLIVKGGSTPNEVAWAFPATSNRFLNRLTIEPPPEPLILGVPVDLRTQGFDALGDYLQITPEVERWRVRDTTLAEIDSVTGMLTPRRDGHIVVEVTAGGWRDTSAAYTIVADESQQAFEETWYRSVEDRWGFWGDPLPIIVHDSAGLSSFWNRGDLSFASGTYSRAEFDLTQGFGFEAQVSSKITSLKWQLVRLQVVSYLDSVALARWRDRSQPVPIPGHGSYCAAVYPGGTGLMDLRRIGLEASNFFSQYEAPDQTPSGSRYRLRLQVFPDGSCGLALNGEALGRSPPTLDLARRYRILLEGQSVGTRLLVGPLQAWRGVRNDVDWSRVTGR